ncbi:hypothetical protein WG66_000133 [Moniliophthora roreri]|nr:hypothetical protein WG66_000133 [Moniliophthora roreri]
MPMRLRLLGYSPTISLTCSSDSTSRLLCTQSLWCRGRKNSGASIRSTISAVPRILTFDMVSIPNITTSLSNSCCDI